MNEQERELDLMVGELEHENKLIRARNGRLEAEVTVLTEMVRVLSAKIAKLEAEKTIQALHDENERLGLYDLAVKADNWGQP